LPSNLKKFLYETELPRLFAADNNAVNIKFGLFYICDIIDYCNKEDYKDKWDFFFEKLLKHACKTEPELR